ncbi:hypothetical protein MAR_015481 [Mya arenaria]|uniref:THAP-type domain-containing protein n=1 Tax=Mya arenaria TaxID=6604 RepID=A0ABY7FKE1_MYAAR|nr:hypothetical protein MAR_015481 [Mya arenaria]
MRTVYPGLCIKSLHARIQYEDGSPFLVGGSQPQQPQQPPPAPGIIASRGGAMMVKDDPPIPTGSAPRFPKDKDRGLKWQKSLRRRDFMNYLKLWEPSQHDRLCSQHFISGNPSKDPCHPDYSPSVFSFTSPQHPQQTPARTYPGPYPLQREFDQLKADYSSLKIEYQRLLCENRDLKDKMESEKFTYKNLSNNAITSLTGLPSVAVFLWLLTLMSGLIKPTGKLCRDRGFLISDELAAHGATLAIPPFARGKTQFSQQEVECARILYSLEFMLSGQFNELNDFKS